MFKNVTESDNKIQNVNGLSPLEKALVLSYLQGCVYSWCNSHGTETFKAQYFLGAQNHYWQGTPLHCLYSKRLRDYDGDSDQAVKQAGRDAGHLLKYLLHEDKRYFETESDGYSRWYSWDGRNDEDLLDSSDIFHQYITDAKK